VSDTWDAEDRAIARALDAASEAETRGADEQLVDAYTEVLAHMPIAEVSPADALEDRVVAAALARRPAAVPALEGVRARRRLRVRLAALAAAAVAAAVVVGVIVQSGDSSRPVPGGHIALSALQRADIDALLRTPGTRAGSFGSTGGNVVIAPDGKAAIYGLTDKGALSVGLVSSGGTTVIGPARATGGVIAFVVDHPERVTAVQLLRNGTELARAAVTPR
jgi:hypothetical protein